MDSAFSSGSGVIHYTGHGSYTALAGDDNIFNNNDARSLANLPVPLFVSLTCIIGRYDIYFQNCLSEELVLNPNGGTLAAISASGLSWNHYAALFGAELYRLHTDEGTQTLGSLFLGARQAFGPLSGLHADAIRTYNLLGDPAIKLRGGGGGTPPSRTSTYALWRWETFDYDDLENPAISGDQAVSGDAGVGNLATYALGPSALIIENGAAPGSGNAKVKWSERVYATDLNYTLMLSTNLLVDSWHPVTNDVSYGISPAEDPSMEWVEADVPFSTDEVFFRVDVERR